MLRGYSITYCKRNGEIKENQLPELLAGVEISQLQPIRRPTSYRGQRNLTGLHYSPVTKQQHPFESRLEQAALIRIDHEQLAQNILTQPFALLYTDGEDVCGHIPDILLKHDGKAPLLIDVKPKAFVAKHTAVFEKTEAMCESIGWRYAIWTEPEPAYRYNLSFLYGYHRRPIEAESCTSELRELLDQGALSLDVLLGKAKDPIRLKPTLFHLLWQRALQTSLHVPLNSRSLISLGET